MKAISLIILQLIFCISVSATTYYVSPSGSNNYKGKSEDAPFQVVQYAIEHMKSKDTLVILDGFYTGILHLKSGITIRAKHPRKVIFSGAVHLIANFEHYTDKIYKAKIDEPIKQLFFNNIPMTWANGQISNGPKTGMRVKNGNWQHREQDLVYLPVKILAKLQV